MNNPMLAYPQRNAATIATTRGNNPIPEAGPSRQVNPDAMIMAGMPIRKENSAASFGCIPLRRAVPILEPDREMPEAIAMQPVGYSLQPSSYT